MKKLFLETIQLIDEVLRNSKAWHTRDAEVGGIW